MKKLFSVFAMAAVVLASCVKEQAPVVDGEQNNIDPSDMLVEKVFTVGDIESKTYIDGTLNGGKIVIKWCSDDEISVWDGVANRKFTMVGEPDGNSATFKGLVSPSATDFYAIYPYDENLQYSYDEANKRMLFTVVKPAVQYANPEGGLADGSAYACGKADADGHIRFENRSALLKFSLSTGMKVKALTIKGNEDDDILAGTLDFRYNESNNFTLGWRSAGKSTEITFCNQDGSNLKTGVDYYISLTGNRFGSGYDVTLTFDDNTTVTRSSSKEIQIMSNQIYKLANGPLSMSMFETGEGGDGDEGDPTTSYYAAYMAGQDIMIAGKAYNKSVYGDGTLVKTGETVDLTSGGKVYFVEPGAVSKIGPTYSATKYIVIGDDPTQRTQVTQSASIKVGQTLAHYAFLNLDIDMQITATGNDVLTVVNNNSTVERIAFDNCRLEYPTNGRQFIYKGDSGTAFQDMAFHNCDFVFTVTDSHAYLLKVDSSTAEHGKFDFYNNVFWHTSSFGAGKGINIVAGTNNATIDELIFKNNTFVNMKTQSNSSSYFAIMNKVGDTKVNIPKVDIQNNIFYNTVADCNEYVVRNSADAGTCVNNVAFMGETEKTIHPFANGTPTGMTKFTQLTESPFTSVDLVNGKFVKSDAYKNYGASR